MNENPNRLPGIGSDRSAQPRKILLSDQGKILLPVGKIISGAVSRDPLNTGDLDVLRAGMLLGKISASGKYAPSILGVLTTAYTGVGTSVTSMVVSLATAVEIVRRIGATGTFYLTGPATANGAAAKTEVTYSAVDVATGIITVTDPNVNAVVGSFIQPTDGSEVAKGILETQYGLKVTDKDAASIDIALTALLVGGFIDASQIINYPTDTGLIAYIQDTWLNAVGRFIFDDDF